MPPVQIVACGGGTGIGPSSAKSSVPPEAEAMTETAGGIGSVEV